VGYSTIAEMFVGTTAKFGDKVLYREKKEGRWIGYTGKEVREIVEQAAYGLAALGVDTGDKVGLISTNCPHWAFSDYAIITLGAATVAVYPTLIPTQMQYILDHSESKVAFAQDQEQVDKVLEVWDKLPRLEWVVCFDESVKGRHDKVLTFQELQEKGREYRQQEGVFKYEERVRAIKPDDLLTLIYTSGTTGAPKGVMLTHNNLISNIVASLEVLDLDHTDELLSFLPLSHSFERMAGHFLTFSVGATVNYAESIETVIPNMAEVQPTVVLSVPRLYEKMYSGVQAKFASGSPLKRKIAAWAVDVGYQYVKARREGNISAGLKWKKNLADKLVFSKVQALLGPRFRFFVSGGAPLSAEIGLFFDAAGIIILEGYGLTETSPVLTVNPLSDYRFGTVGPPLSNVELKIAPDGEILARGPNVMMGYYKDPEATKEAIDEEGWFHTGDIGVLEDGYLKITDRKKNLIVTAGGKNIAPAPIENALVLNKYIEQAVVIGDRRKFVSALIVPDFVALTAWAEEQGLDTSDQEALVKNEKVQALYEHEIGEVMKNFSRFEAIKKFLLLPKPFTIEDGTLTPSLKVKRKIVEDRYKQEIDALYEE